MQIDDALGSDADGVAQVRSAIFIKDVVVQDVLTNGFLARIVKAVQHGVEDAFQRYWIGLKVRLHDIDAGEEAAVRPAAERAHHVLDAIADGQRTNGAVVQRIDVFEEPALVVGVFGVLPTEVLGQVGAGVLVHQCVLLIDQLGLLLLDLLFDAGAEGTGVFDAAAEFAYLAVVGVLHRLVGKPSGVFR